MLGNILHLFHSRLPVLFMKYSVVHGHGYFSFFLLLLLLYLLPLLPLPLPLLGSFPFYRSDKKSPALSFFHTFSFSISCQLFTLSSRSYST
jgi:hypothetical protein